VAGHIFQARPVWIYTQSNITSIIFTWVHNTSTEKKIKKIIKCCIQQCWIVLYQHDGLVWSCLNTFETSQSILLKIIAITILNLYNFYFVLTLCLSLSFSETKRLLWEMSTYTVVDKTISRSC
jgi:hypothetical protein